VLFHLAAQVASCALVRDEIADVIDGDLICGKDIASVRNALQLKEFNGKIPTISIPLHSRNRLSFVSSQERKLVFCSLNHLYSIHANSFT
jgi:hypothetical protein